VEVEAAISLVHLTEFLMSHPFIVIRLLGLRAMTAMERNGFARVVAKFPLDVIPLLVCFLASFES
jgi:hypothetical protein